ncbi:MAG: aminoglycoside N(3)-acetyltransferase [Chloroflexota bacterium]
MTGLLTVGRLSDDLRRLAIAGGDLVMVHASMRAIGQVEGRAQGVVSALDQAVGPDGTLLMNLGARDDWAWVNDRPEDEREALLVESVPFDYLDSPADPDNSVLAEVFRQTPGTSVNDHPDGRFGGRGRLAHQLLANPPWDDYYGPGSLLERFVRSGGKILRLGADLSTVTLLHYAEYLVPIEPKRRVRRHHLVTGRNGPEVMIVESLDDSDGIVDYPGEDYFAVLLRAYLDAERAIIGRVGHAPSELINGPDLVEFAVAWMATHLGGPGASRS